LILPVDEWEWDVKYLCLIYQDEQLLDAMTTTEYDALVSEALAFDEDLHVSGHHICSNALQLVQSATSVRVHAGKLSITDGPFVETKEQVGGYILIEARDLNEAIRIAAKIPPARLGGIEIRPVLDLAADPQHG